MSLFSPRICRLHTCGALSLGLLVLGLFGSCTGRVPTWDDEDASRPNVLLITLDTTRADRIGAYGYERAETPNIDRLAAEGTLFTRAWSTAALTAPAHASMLTGLYPATHGVRNNLHYVLSDETSTLAEELRKGGYRTGAFVSALPLGKHAGLGQGFDVFDDGFGYRADGRPKYARNAEDVTERALVWLSEISRREADSPVFAWVHYYDPHAPFTPPEPFRSRHLQKPYDGEIAYMDAQIGRLLSGWESAGFSADAVVAVVADHGEGLGEHQEEAHGLLLHESVIRVPLLFHAPGRMPQAKRDDRLASVVDIYPTILRLAGMPLSISQGHDLSRRSWLLSRNSMQLPSRLEGRVGDLLGRAEDARILLAETTLPWEAFGWAAIYSVRRGNEKWLSTPNPRYFNLEQDPGELHGNLVAPDGSADLPGILEELLDGLQDGSSEGRHVSPEEIEKLRSLGYTRGALTAASGPEATGSADPRSGRDPYEAIGDFNLYSRARDYMYDEPRQCLRAESILNALVLGDPNNPEFVREYALAVKCVGKPRAAERILRSLLEKYPLYFEATNALLNLLKENGRREEIPQIILDLKEQAPQYHGFDTRLVRSWLETGETHRALEYSSRAIESRPRDLRMLATHGRALSESGRTEEALQVFHRVLAEDPSERLAWQYAAELLASLGQGEQALSLLRDCLTRRPRDRALQRAVMEWRARSPASKLP